MRLGRAIDELPNGNHSLTRSHFPIGNRREISCAVSGAENGGHNFSHTPSVCSLLSQKIRCPQLRKRYATRHEDLFPLESPTVLAQCPPTMRKTVVVETSVARTPGNRASPIAINRYSNVKLLVLASIATESSLTAAVPTGADALSPSILVGHSVDLGPIQSSVVTESSFTATPRAGADVQSPSVHANHQFNLELPNGPVTSTLACPFDSPGDCELAEMTSEELAESEKVFSQDFAELSYISRMLSMSLDPEVPLLDRFKYLSNVSQTLDKHFSKRLGTVINLHRDAPELLSHKIRQRVRPKTQYEEKFRIAVQTIVDRQ